MQEVQKTLAIIATASQPDAARVVLSADSQTRFLSESRKSAVKIHLVPTIEQMLTPATGVLILQTTSAESCLVYVA